MQGKFILACTNGLYRSLSRGVLYKQFVQPSCTDIQKPVQNGCYNRSVQKVCTAVAYGISVQSSCTRVPLELLST